MKQTPQKQKRLLKSNLKRSSTKSKRTRATPVKLVLSKRIPLRHLRLVEHKHTGTLIHRRHTSHVALIAMLVLVGVLLYASQTIVQAQQLSQSGNLTVGVIVPGPPPTTEATILSPLDGATVSADTVDTSGTCEIGTLVIIYNNGQSSGSVLCTDAGIFDLTIQIFNGQNALQAIGYDNLNQPGPASPIVTITNQLPGNPPVVAAPKPVARLVSPAIIPAISTKKTCDTNPNPTPVQAGGPLIVRVACIIRGVEPLAQFQLGLLIEGGQPPYALNVKWNAANVNDTLVSIPNPGYKTIDAVFPLAGQFTLDISAKDASGNSAFTQAVAEINGTPAAVSPLTILQNDVLHTSWFQTPVPLYLVAVVLTLGFWFGDLFDRYFGARKSRGKLRKAH